MDNRLRQESLDFLQHLTARDLLDMEDTFCQSLARFFSFNGHALYFPTQSPLHAPKLLTRERRLLLPLEVGGGLLAVFMARNVRIREIKSILSVLPALVELCLANLALIKAARTDSVTSLATEEALFIGIEQRVVRLREFLEDPASIGDVSMHSLGFALAFIRISNGDSIVRQIDDHMFIDKFLRELANTCLKALSPEILAARVGRYEFALLIPGAGRSVCENVVQDVLGRMQSVCLPDPLFQRPIRPILCAGYAVYPQDMRNADMVYSAYDQARRLLSLVSLASDLAQGMIRGESSPYILALARILHEGGVIKEVLSSTRIGVNLGRKAGAIEGMRFAVRDRKSGVYKGEIVLLQVGIQDSVAEILHIFDAADPPNAGDVLSLLADDTKPSGRKNVDVFTLGADGICGYGDFLKGFAHAMDKFSHFTLSIVRFKKVEPHVLPQARQQLGELVKQCKQVENGVGFACGEYGDNGLIFFHPFLAPESLLSIYRELCARLKDCTPTAGLAGYPFLHFNRSEIRDCALKALDYARLLPEPRAGVCNSLALNISADRLYSLGDIFGAIEEYKLALLADKSNTMALNSLGVCFSALGRREEARRYFLSALKYGGPLEGQTCYNLGAVSQLLGKRRTAAHYYRRCISCEPEHLFAHIRLGQLCESNGRTKQARIFYERAVSLEDSRQVPGSARRLLAGLMARGRRQVEARELLREVLAYNPEDAAALLEMAKLYLNGDESPELAEMFARRSLLVRDRPEARRILARALRTQGRNEEAAALQAG